MIFPTAGKNVMEKKGGRGDEGWVEEVEEKMKKK